MHRRQSSLSWGSAWLVIQLCEELELYVGHPNDATVVAASVPLVLIVLDARNRPDSGVGMALADSRRLEEIGYVDELRARCRRPVDVDGESGFVETNVLLVLVS